MTTPLHPRSPNDCDTCQGEPSELAVWARVEPVFAYFDSLQMLRLHLVYAAASRRPDEVLTALGRIAEADDPGNLAEAVYAEAFCLTLSRIAEAVSWRDGRDYGNALFLAKSVLHMVAAESTVRGQMHSGKAITSRTWARTFVVSPSKGYRRRNRLEAEALAALARFGGFFASWRDSLCGEGLVDRVASRFAPTGDIWQLVTDDGEIVADFEARCLEKRIPLRLAERQLTKYVADGKDYDAVGGEERLALISIREELFAADEEDEQ
jgi:hypothetical protein